MTNISFPCCRGAFRGEFSDARLKPRQIEAVYNRIAPVYDIWGRLTESRARERALALAAVNDGEAILEVAPGTGLAFVELVRANPSGETIGLDLSAGMLARARAKVNGLPGRWELRQGDALALPFADASFDLLLNNYMFDLLPWAVMPRVLAEFRRVLKPGGRLVLVNMTRGRTRAQRMFEMISRLSPAVMAGCRGVELTPLLGEAGFAVGRREYFVQMLFPSEVLVATRLPDAP